MTSDQTRPKPKLGAEKLTPEEQRRRFEELAREAGCDEGSEAKLETAVKMIGRAKVRDEGAASASLAGERAAGE